MEETTPTKTQRGKNTNTHTRRTGEFKFHYRKRNNFSVFEAARATFYSLPRASYSRRVFSFFWLPRWATQGESAASDVLSIEDDHGWMAGSGQLRRSAKGGRGGSEGSNGVGAAVRDCANGANGRVCDRRM